MNRQQAEERLKNLGVETTAQNIEDYLYEYESYQRKNLKDRFRRDVIKFCAEEKPTDS